MYVFDTCVVISSAHKITHNVNLHHTNQWLKVEKSNCGESSMFDGLIETGTFQLTWANQSRKMILDADCICIRGFGSGQLTSSHLFR